MKKALILDCTIDRPWTLGAHFKRYFPEGIVVESRRTPQEDLPKDLHRFSHVVISGSKTSCLSNQIWIDPFLDFLIDLQEKQIPVLGICFGHQMIVRSQTKKSGLPFNHYLRQSKTPELGWIRIEQNKPHPLSKGLPEKFHIFGSHVEECYKLPSDFVSTASSSHCQIQAYYSPSKPIYGFQFHPERKLSDGQRTISLIKKSFPKQSLFEKAESGLDNENVAKKIFENFFQV